MKRLGNSLRAAPSKFAHDKDLRHGTNVAYSAVHVSMHHDEKLVPTAIEEPRADDPRRARILAKTIYRELRSGGLDERAVLALATELLGLVAEDMRSAS